MTVAHVVAIFQITTAAAVIAFMVAYAIWSPWRQTATGWSLMTLATTVLTFLVNSLLKLLIGQYPLFDWVRLFSYVLLTVVWWTLFAQLRRAQRRPTRLTARLEITMPTRLKTALSVGVHALVALLISVLIAHGIDLPATWSMILETAILGAVVAAYVSLTHWLSTRPATSVWGRAAVWLSKLLTAGTGTLTTTAPKVPDAVTHVRSQRRT